MIVTLKGQEFVYGRYGRGIGGLQAYLPATRQCIRRVLDEGAPGRHHGSPRHLAIVYEPGDREVTEPESAGNAAQVRPDPSYAG